MPERQRESNANEEEQRRNRTAEHPSRPEPDPNTMEGPGGRRESGAEEDARNKSTRLGER